MFSKTTKPVDRPAAAPVTHRAAAPSIISADLKVVGDLHSSGEIHVEGFVEGDIRTTSLLVGEQANLTGEIVAETVKVHGAVTGQIKAKSVHLSKSARITGDVLHEELAVEKGAFMEGHCRRLDSAKNPVSAPATLVASEPGGTPPSGDRKAKQKTTAAA